MSTSTLKPIPPPPVVASEPEAPVVVVPPTELIVADGPSFACQVQTKHICLGRKLKLGEAFVRGRERLYLDIRKTPVDETHPLTEDEILPQVLCATHARGIVPSYPLANTLNLMARWQDNLHRQAEKETRRLLRSVERELQAVTAASALPPPPPFWLTKKNTIIDYGTSAGRKKKPDGVKKKSNKTQQQPKQQKRGR